MLLFTLKKEHLELEFRKVNKEVLMRKYKIVFLVRKFNDIDNNLPLIDKFVSEGHSVRLISLRTDVLDNFLVNYLNKKLKIFIEYPALNGKGSKLSLYYMLSNFLSFIIRRYEIKFSQKYTRFALKKIDSLIIIASDARGDVGEYIFNNIRPDIIIADNTNIIKGRVYKNVTSYASNNSIPIARLCHGVDPLVHDDSYVEKNRQLMQRYAYDRIYDFSQSKAVLSDSKTFVLGSLRYSMEWVKKYHAFYEYDTIKNPLIKNKTVVLLLSAQFNFNVKKVAEMINCIASQFNVDILLKPHTRNNAISHDLISMIEAVVNIRFVYSSTAWLIDNSDVTIICGVTSVAIHSILVNKPVICAEYTKIPKEESYYSKFKSTCIADNLDDVVHHLDNILHTDISCYSEPHVSNFLQFMVNPNNSNSVINDHYDLMLKIIKNEV